MKFAEDDKLARHTIRAYGDGWLKIGERTFRESLILTRDRLIEGWGIRSVGELAREDFERLAGLDPEMVLLGTGASQEFPDPALAAPLMERGIGLEVMTTAAAARTYNLLAGDGRGVVAALML
jgi:uncharacterized protein